MGSGDITVDLVTRLWKDVRSRAHLKNSRDVLRGRWTCTNIHIFSNIFIEILLVFMLQIKDDALQNFIIMSASFTNPNLYLEDNFIFVKK